MDGNEQSACAANELASKLAPAKAGHSRPVANKLAPTEFG
jgi:hypothetical protein